MSPEEKKAYKRDWYLTNRERVLAVNAAWHLKNVERHRVTSEAWAKSNKERRKQTAAARYLANRERILSKNAQWRLENKERMKQLNSSWAKNNPEKRRTSAAIRRKSNIQKHREIEAIKSQNRRAKKLDNGGTLSRGIIWKLRRLQSNRCAVCRELLTKTGTHLDHIIPLSAGGPHSDENVQLLCPPCNGSKGARDPVCFMQSRGFLL